MSGISADDNAMDTYQKLSRSKIQYVVFKIDKVNGSETIVVEKEGVSSCPKVKLPQLELTSVRTQAATQVPL